MCDGVDRSLTHSCVLVSLLRCRVRVEMQNRENLNFTVTLCIDEIGTNKVITGLEFSSVYFGKSNS